MRRLLALCLLAGCHADDVVLPPCLDVAAEPWPEADRLFEDAHWQRGDRASSVDLGDDRVLWLFGESVVDGTRRDNSVAIQTGRDPTTASMTFAWGLFPAQGARKLRPGGGARLGPGLILFFTREDADGANGWTGFWIPNPDEDPSLWRREEAFLPPQRFPVTLGTAVVVEGTFVYSYGLQEPGDRRLYLARFELGDAQGVNLSRPQWWGGDWIAHTAFLSTEPGLFPGAAPTVLSVSSWDGGRIAVHGAGDTVAVRTAPSLTGPWSEPCGAAVGFPSAMGHPELLGADLVLTYVAGDRPRFLKLHRP